MSVTEKLGFLTIGALASLTEDTITTRLWLNIGRQQCWTSFNRLVLTPPSFGSFIRGSAVEPIVANTNLLP